MRYLLFLFLPLLIWSACQTPASESSDTPNGKGETTATPGTTTTGAIENAATGTMYIQGWNSKVRGRKVYLVPSEEVQEHRHFRHALDSCKADSSGFFYFNPKTAKEGFYQIHQPQEGNIYEIINLYLVPGDTLTLETSNPLKKQVLKGNDAAYRNDYQWEARQKFFRQVDVRKRNNESKTFPKDKFVTYTNQRRAEAYTFLEEYFKDHPITDVYRNYLKAKIDFYWVNAISDYQQYHHYYTNQKWHYFPYDSLGIDYLNDEALNNKCCPFAQEYQTAIGSIMEEHYNRRVKGIPDSLRYPRLLNDRFEVAKEHFKGIDMDIAISNMSQQFFLSMAEANFHDEVGKIEAYYAKNITSKPYHEHFMKTYKKIERIAPGQVAPDFTLPDPAGKPISLSDYKGKVVYIDFWGTWCPPCIKALPKHTELQKEFEGEEVAFLMVALEYNKGNIENWKKYLQNKSVPGIHVVAKGQFMNQEIAPYLIKSAPSYILIDKEGKIVKPRANDPATVANDIRALL